MIFNIPVAGKLKVSCTFLGAPGETLTLKQNGTTMYTVGENTAVVVKQGDYQVTGSVSGYTRTITVKKAGVYAAYPDGAIYWYGREVVAMTTSLSAGYGTAHATENTNNIDLYAWANNNGASSSFAQTVTASAVDTSKYSIIKYKIHVYDINEKYSQGVAQIRYGYKGSAIATDLPGSTLTSGNSTFSIASPKTTTHLAVTAYASWGGYTGDYKAGCYVHAIWME